MTINNIADKLIKSKKIGITCHTSPDGDSLGSVLGLLQGLLKLGKEAYVMSKDPLPKTFEYMPFSDEIVKNIDYVLDGTDTVVVLDCGNVDRINSNLNLNDREYALLNIDHHISNDMYGDINYVNTDAAAVAEIIFDILKSLNVDIDKSVATCLYTSLITDTGSFRHSNTTKLTHEIAGSLIDTGIDFTEIHRVIFENKKFQRIKLYGKVIENMELVLDYKVCIMEITDIILSELNMDKGDTSDVITLGTQIDSVEVTILLKESEDGLKVSLRSKNIIDVRNLAEEFGGGGHIRAAGFSINKPLSEVREILINKLEKELM
jgi:phosphoesterase RecJ-like protein